MPDPRSLFDDPDGPTDGLRARWATVDRHLADALLPEDDALDAALAASDAADLPPISVAPLQGALLHVLARAIGARRILEVGTLGGYSTIWMARALPPDGEVVTLEIDPAHARVAQANVDRAGVGDRVEVRVAPAAESLADLAEEDREPFDMVFIDADKESNVAYVAAAADLARPGALVIVDNTVRGGTVADEPPTDPSVLGVRRLHDLLASDPRFTATAVQTIGAKGWDGLTFAVIAT